MVESGDGQAERARHTIVVSAFATQAVAFRN